jgi:hypothetical protein
MKHEAAIVRSAADIRILSQEVKAAVQVAEWAELQKWEKARATGKLLIDVKRRAGHGHWLKVLEHSGQNHQRIGELIRVAEHYDAITRADDFDPSMSLREGLNNWSAGQRSDNSSEKSPILGNLDSPQPVGNKDTPENSHSADFMPDEKSPSGPATAWAERDAAARVTEPTPGDADETTVGPVDPEGHLFPEKARPALAIIPKLQSWCDRQAALAAELPDLNKQPGGRRIAYIDLQEQAAGLRLRVWGNRPTHVCPDCQGKRRLCGLCDGEGWVPEHDFKGEASPFTPRGTR